MRNIEPRVSIKKESAIPRVYVVAGIIKNSNNEVLLSKRHVKQHQGGLWEFPGGKKEDNETVKQALARELEEELGISIVDAEPFHKLEHDYSDKAVLLDFWLVQSFSGEPQGLEGQQVQWVPIEKLKHYQFPEANVPVVEALLAARG